MKKLVPGAATTATVLTAAQLATGDVVVDLGNAQLGAGEGFSVDATGLTGTLSAINASWDYDEPVSDGSWASDVRLVVTSSDGFSTSIGGFDTASDTLWAFDGADSDLPGFYSDSIAVGPFDSTDDTYTISFTNDWAADPNPNDYANITVTLKGLSALPGDVDGDNDVDFDDLLQILSNFLGTCDACPEDIDGDGVVGFRDLLIVLSHWGPGE